MSEPLSLEATETIMKSSFSEKELPDYWPVYESFYQTYGMASHQIRSFDEFITELCPKIIETNGTITMDEEASGKKSFYKKITFDNVVFGKPSCREMDDQVRFVYPSEARRRHIVYSSPIYCDVTLESVEDTQVHKKQMIAEIPVMVRSVLCNLTRDEIFGDDCFKCGEDPYDQGGYFVVSGEKVVISQERGAFGKPYTYKKSLDKQIPKFQVHTEIRNSATSSTHTTTVYVGMVEGVSTFFAKHVSSEGIPLCVLFEAMGISYLDMLKYIPDLSREQVKQMILSLEQGRSLFPKSRKDREGTMKKALSLISAKKTQEELLDEIFGNYDTAEKKAHFIGYMHSRAIKVLTEERKQEDRDHYANKRVDCCGVLLNNVFYTAWKKMITDIHGICQGKGRNADPMKPIRSRPITKKILSCMKTGNWSSYGQKAKKTGTSQQYERYNLLASLSNLRKVHASIGTEGNLTQPRRLHSSCFGFICPEDTPESKDKAGLSKGMAVSTIVSIGANVEEAFEIIKNLEDFDLEFGNGVRVMLNGTIIGSTQNPLAFLFRLSELKRSDGFFSDSSFVHDKFSREVRIWCDAGRLLRPLLVVRDGEIVMTRKHVEKLVKGKISWQDLVSSGLVEFIDPEQQEHSLLSTGICDLMQRSDRENVNYCEIHPSLLFGVCSATIPFSANNPSPRLSYYSSMMKASIALSRFDAFIAPFEHHLLHYPQKPLAITKMAKLMGAEKSPISQSLIVAVLSVSGFGQEDAIILGQNLPDFGGLVSSHNQHFTAEITHEQEQIFPKHAGDGIHFSDCAKRKWCKSCGKEVVLCPECSSEFVPKGTCCRKKEDRRRYISDAEATRVNNARPDVKNKWKILGPRNWACLCKEYEERIRTEHLDTFGVVEPGSMVYEGDILVCLVNNKSTGRKDDSIYFTKEERGQVVDVVYTQNPKGHICIRVSVMTVRIPIVGDKATSSHSQKGTFSRFIKPEDMPFSSDPYSAPWPDYIINSLALPSRMTIGQLKESSTAKARCAAYRDDWKGKVWNSKEEACKDLEKKILDKLKYSGIGGKGDATPFTSNFDAVVEELKNRGFSAGGKQMLIDGTTGKPIEAMIFMGPISINRLKHMVYDKIHARSTGKVQSLTRQPTEGRSRNGGLKVGTMEKDVLISAGASFCLNDRLFESCDRFEMWVCASCGLTAVASKEKKYCRACRGKSDVVKIAIPYGTKLVFQELFAMGIVPRILVK